MTAIKPNRTVRGEHQGILSKAIHSRYWAAITNGTEVCHGKAI